MIFTPLPILAIALLFSTTLISSAESETTKTDSDASASETALSSVPSFSDTAFCCIHYAAFLARTHNAGDAGVGTVIFRRRDPNKLPVIRLSAYYKSTIASLSSKTPHDIDLNSAADIVTTMWLEQVLTNKEDLKLFTSDEIKAFFAYFFKNQSMWPGVKENFKIFGNTALRKYHATRIKKYTDSRPTLAGKREREEGVESSTNLNKTKRRARFA